MTPSVQAEPLVSAQAVTADPVGSEETAVPAAKPRERRGGVRLGAFLRRREVVLAAVVLAVPLVFLYWKITGKLVTDWYNIPDDSHGFLVPLFALFLLWDKRGVLKAAPVKGSWAGLWLVVLGLVTLIFGVFGAELFLSRISFIMLAAGLVWMFFGRTVLREVTFPLAILILAIPFPAIVFNEITFPLQILASKMASNLLPVLGVPVFREGNVIQLPAMKLEVAEACSGIRSLMSLFTLSVFYGYFLERTKTRRWVMALASIPIAVIANALRIVGTGLCVQYWDPSKAEGFFHEFSGWVMFVISMTSLYVLHRVLKLAAPAGARA